MHGYFVAGFPYLNATGFVHVCMRISTDNEARARIIQYWPGLHYSVDNTAKERHLPVHQRRVNDPNIA